MSTIPCALAHDRAVHVDNSHDLIDTVGLQAIQDEFDDISLCAKHAAQSFGRSCADHQTLLRT